MGVFQFETDDGRAFEVEAPDAQSAYSAFQQGSSPSPASGLKDQARLGDSSPAENRVDQGFAVAGAMPPRPELQSALGQASQARQTGGARGQGGFMETADAGLRGAADALTFGTADEITAGLGTGFGLLGDYGKELQRQRSIDAYDAEHSPWARIGGQMAGSVAGGLGAVSAAPGAARVALGMGGKTLPGKIAQSAVSGGLLSAAHGFGSGEGGVEGRLGQGASEGLWGLGLGGAAPIVGAAVGQVAGRIMNKAPAAAPTTEALKAESSRSYKLAKSAGLVVSPQSYDRAVNDIAQTMADEGLDPSLHSKATAAMGRLMQARGTPMQLQDLDTLRQIIGDAAGSIEPGERRVASIMKEKLDDYVMNLGQADIIAGDPKLAASALGKGRELWRRAKKAELIDTATEKAERGAASTGSGGNIDNATRQKIRQLLDNPKTSRQFSADEKQALELVIRGGRMQNLLRLAGKLSPQGNGLMAALGLGATVANPVMAAAPVAGIVAKNAAEFITARNLKRAEDLIRRGAPAPARGSPLAAAYAQLISQGAGQGAVSGTHPREPLKITVTQPNNWPQRSP